jgi:2-methylcitrate dehydratase PrpD
LEELLDRSRRDVKMKLEIKAAQRQIETAAQWAASFRLEQAPQDVIDLSTWQIANILAAILAGSRSAAAAKVWRSMQKTMSPGPCTVIPFGEKVSLADALYLHVVFANALELDDFHYRGHLGQAAVVTPLTMAQFCRGDGRTMLRAQIVANELAGRLGWAVTAEIRHGHMRSYLQRFAAAAAAGVYLGLSEQEFADALAIAMTLPDLPLHPGMYSPETKVLAGAAAVVEGVRAAFFAKEGLTGAHDILEHRAGFYRQFTMQRKVLNPFVQLGEAWCTYALCFKRYAACGYASGAVDAAREIHAHPASRFEDIDRIEVATSYPALTLERLAAPHEPDLFTPVNVQFSILRSVAAALALGELRGYHFSAEAFPALIPPIRRLWPRSRLVHDWKFSIHQLMGIDAGLNKGGGKHSADMWQFYKTSRAFHSMFGSARAIGPGDLVKLLRLPKDERNFFFQRWGRSLRSYFWKSSSDGNEAYRPLGDLRRLSFRMGSRVTVFLNNGERLSAERIIPTGMAGDPNRKEVVRDKLIAEGERVIGRETCEHLWAAVTGLPGTSPARIIALATGQGGDDIHAQKN